ncbi:hypothetical protein FBU59_005970 [Linderina macrospora]|uniref:Uncharacterized protein n=1 Tax=Linderina macrospora TaxID=4868 RepID=A0ACC1J1F5_9FUNG|nr:hypothetical protein FBU59_005970 [Linderina macrospora]
MEIGVVASPMRVEAQRTNSSIRRAASSPGLASVGHVIGTADEDGLLPDTMVLDEVLPEYPGTGETVYSSEVVGQWRLGERAIEKPPIHPRGA